MKEIGVKNTKFDCKANKQLQANKNHIKKSLTKSIMIINKMITVEYLTLHSGPEKIKYNFC